MSFASYIAWYAGTLVLLGVGTWFVFVRKDGRGP